MRAKSMRHFRGVGCCRKVLTGLGCLLDQSSLFTLVIVVGFLIGVPKVGWADTFTFNLEDQNLGTFTSITDTQAGITLTVHRQDNDIFTIEDLSSFDVSDFGNRTLGNFSGTFGPGATLVLNFSAPISSGS